MEQEMHYLARLNHDKRQLRGEGPTDPGHSGGTVVAGREAMSEISASTTSAETPEQAEKTAVDHALSEESDAFGRGDLSAFVQHFDVPFVRISSEGVKVCPTLSKLRPFTGASSENVSSLWLLKCQTLAIFWYKLFP
jgi:hypothetical protein